MYNEKTKLASDVPVILIESNSLLRDGLVKCLESTRYNVISAGSSLGSLPSTLERPPELIVVGGNNLTLVTRLIQNCNEKYPASRPVVLGDHRADDFVPLLHAGAHACFRRDITFEVLLVSLELVMLGVKFICPCDEQAAVAGNGQNLHTAGIPIRNERSFDSVSHRFSAAEISVLECLVQGDSNKVIARKLHVVEQTAKVHIKSIMRKIGAVNRTQAAIWAISHLESRAESDESPTAQYHMYGPNLSMSH